MPATKRDNKILKSNTILMVLLFCCAFLGSDASVADTIIVDGKKVVVNKEVVEVDDSLFTNHSEQDPKDPLKGARKPPKPKKPGAGLSIGVIGGMNLMYATSSTNAAGFQTLGEFVSEDKSLKLNGLYGIKLDYRINMNWQIGVGAQFWKANVFNQFFDESELTTDSLLGFLSLEQGTLSQYYSYPVGPGNETDTTQFNLVNSDLHIKSLDIPIIGRYHFINKENRGRSAPQSGWSVGAGFLVTLYGEASGGPFQLVNASGEYVQLHTDDLNIPSFAINPILEGAWSRSVSEHLIFDAGLRFVLNIDSLNNATTFQLSYKRVGLNLGLSYFF
jgi:hypothetical protein